MAAKLSIFYLPNTTGEGQEGDMQFIRGNKAILEHEKDGKDIHLFEYVRTGYVKYVGQMLCVGYRVKDKDNKGQNRKVIVFELMPIEAELPQKGSFK